MAKYRIFCWDCDTEFTVTYQGEEPMQHCPLCGSDLEANEEVVTEVTTEQQN